MKRSFRRNLRAVSPVIATIIIVAIAIVMSIAVAYWMLGLGAAFTRFEKLEFTTAYADMNSTHYIVHMDLKNTGSASATIDPSYILYNGKPATAYMPPAYPSLQQPVPEFGTFPLDPGQSKPGLRIAFNQTGSTWTSGMTIEIMLHSSAGRDYPKVIVLP